MRVGVARRSITPPVGIDMTGYIGRPGPSVGVHDELYATAIVLDDGATRFGIITLDVLGFDIAKDAEIRARISQASGIDPRNLLITSTHTHAGPATIFLRRCGEPDENYLKWSVSQIAAAVTDACNKLSDASLSLVRAASDLGINRRAWVVEQGIAASETSGIVTDPEIIALLIRTEAESALVYNYACHGTATVHDNQAISADWVGAARAVLEADPRVGISAFLQGCCGDINPSLRGSFGDVRRGGEAVAKPLLDALDSAIPVERVDIKVAWRDVALPYLPLPSEEELEQEISYLRGDIERKRAEGVPRVQIEADQAMLSWAEDALRTLLEGGGEACVRVPLQAVSIGDVTLLAIPGEVFCEIGLDIKRLGDKIMVIGYANGNIGYIPTREAYAEGGYEVCSAYRYYGVKMIGPESEDIILNAARQLVAEVRTG